MRLAVFLLAAPFLASAQSSLTDTLRPPGVMREFRGMWVATVNNMDWPSRADLSTADQQRELLAILDRAASLKMNAIVFQVRPEADALYVSRYEPWSRYLTGRQGRPPSPAWDPLAFAVTEAHKRGLELHAWFNPYRVAFWRDSATHRSHVSKSRPSLVVPYAQYLWMDPANPESRARMTRVVLDVARRYDVDGVHIDDYFYPYPEVDRAGRRIEFPDAKAFAAYRRGGGQLTKGDWRRRNVNMLVREFYAAVKDEKPWVKVGISPFGIWRPGYPATTTAGIDQFDELYADVRKWVHEGTLDYVTPQLYWPVSPPEQSYPVLLRWWVEQSLKGRHVWPGIAAYKLPISGPKKMSAAEIIEEIRLTRAQPGATGHVLFNARIIMDNVDGLSDKLAAAYSELALVPASPWLDSVPPPPPRMAVTQDSTSGALTFRFAPQGAQRIAWWLVQSHKSGAWRDTLLPGTERTYILKDAATALGAGADVVSVSAVDRAGNISAPTTARVDRR